MRKWIRIPVALLLLLAVFLLPRNETEIHKRRCQAAWNGLHGKSVTERIKGVYYKLTKTTPNNDQGSDKYWELESSREALVEVGYLVRHRIEVTSHPHPVEDAFRETGLENAFVSVEGRRDHIVIIAPRSEIVGVSNMVRRIDQRWSEELGRATGGGSKLQ